jgi:hypothetical protein
VDVHEAPSRLLPLTGLTDLKPSGWPAPRPPARTVRSTCERRDPLCSQSLSPVRLRQGFGATLSLTREREDGARDPRSVWLWVALTVSSQRRALRAPRGDLCSSGLGSALFTHVNPKSPTACGPAMVPDPGACVGLLPPHAGSLTLDRAPRVRSARLASEPPVRRTGALSVKFGAVG